MSTCDFIWHDLCCKCCAKRSSLRETIFNRKVMNFRMGIEKLNNEMDIGSILKKLRRFSYFMKLSLNKNQRHLLKLKSSKFLPSSDDLDGVNMETHRKVVDENSLLNNYIKRVLIEHDKRDEELLIVTDHDEVA